MYADPIATLAIRRLTDADRDEVERLAQLDSHRAPEGELVGVEVEGRLLAVAPLDGGETIADPFSRTAELRSLLELRVKQLRRRRDGRRRFVRLADRPAPGGRLAGSPPGAGGRLLALPPERP